MTLGSAWGLCLCPGLCVPGVCLHCVWVFVCVPLFLLCVSDCMCASLSEESGMCLFLCVTPHTYLPRGNEGLGPKNQVRPDAS